MVAAVAAAAPAMAQDSSVETVVVTGSRIPQQGLYSSSPVTSVGQQEATYQGTVNVETLLNNLPSVVAGQNEGVTNGSSGTADVDLRGLGAVRTLVLVDGKRLQPGDAFASSGAADLNIIPVQLIDHVEVLTGGASATYGSDALAGVVNFITRKDFEGAEITGQYNVDQNDNTGDFPRNAPGAGNLLDEYGIARPKTDIFDGQTADVHMLIGSNSADGKGNVTFYAGYQNIQAVTENARDFSACSAGSTNTVLGGPYNYHYCGGSSTVPEGKFVSIDAGNYNSTHVGGALPTTFYGTTAGTFTTHNPGSFNYAPFNYLQRPDTRYTAGAEAHYEVNKSLDIYSSLMFMDDHTIAQVAPGGAFQTPFTINCNNPLLSAQEEASICPAGATSINTGIPFTGNAVTDAGNEATVLIGRRSVEAGDRIDDLRHTDYRIVIGAKGDLGNNWSYDFSGQYGVAVLADAEEGYFSNKNFQNALHVVDVGGVPTCESVIDGSDSACVPINVFTAPTLNASRSAAISSPLTAAQLAYVSANGLAQGQTTEYVVQGTLTGDLGSIGGQSPWAKNPIGVSVGSEYRQETITYTPDQELVQGDLLGIGGQRTAVNGAYNVSEVFGEVRVPIIQGVPFAQDLTATGGYRYSSYSSVGSTSTYKYGLEWQPIDDIKFRAGFDHAVRAPNVSELFSSPDVVLFAGQDPCANNGKTNAAPANTAALRAFCQATGLVNFGVTGAPGNKYGAILPCPASQCNQETAGNPNLTPETSDTKTLGVVLTPTFLDGFTATIDYFDIEVKKVVGSYGAAFLLSTCEGNPASPACGLIHRDPVSGFIWSPTGYVENPSSNLGYLKTKGVDFEGNYQADLDDWGLNGWGTFAAAFLGTYTQSFEAEPIPTTSVFFSAGSNKQYNCAGLYGDICGTPQPKWRHQLRLTWGTPWDVNVSVEWRYLEHVALDGFSGNTNLAGAEGDDQIDSHIPGYNYFDLTTQWAITKGLSVTAGVTNILDKGPPINGLALGNGNTFTGTYDYMGRQIFVTGTLKF
jgi:outer membrane receptor protein involved in Fe transport